MLAAHLVWQARQAGRTSLLQQQTEQIVPCKLRVVGMTASCALGAGLADIEVAALHKGYSKRQLQSGITAARPAWHMA